MECLNNVLYGQSLAHVFVVRKLQLQRTRKRTWNIDFRFLLVVRALMKGLVLQQV